MSEKNPAAELPANDVAYHARRETLARLLAAILMDLRKDPTGSQLPYELWSQQLPRATAFIYLMADRGQNTCADMHHAAEELELNKP